MAFELVQGLEVLPLGTLERLLPDAADGEGEIWRGGDGFEAFGYAA